MASVSLHSLRGRICFQSAVCGLGIGFAHCTQITDTSALHAPYRLGMFGRRAIGLGLLLGFAAKNSADCREDVEIDSGLGSVSKGREGKALRKLEMFKGGFSENESGPWQE